MSLIIYLVDASHSQILWSENSENMAEKGLGSQIPSADLIKVD